MIWRRPLAAVHEGETCEEVEQQLHDALADLGETRAVIASVTGKNPDRDMSTANVVRLLLGRELREERT